MSMRILLCLFCLFFSLPVFGYDVFVNGTKVNGLRNQNFQRVESVSFDAAGNVRINAPAYSIEVEAPPVAKQGANDAMVGVSRFWIVAKVYQRNAYRVRLTVNGQDAGDLMPTDGDSARDITHLVVSGQNVVQATFLPVGQGGMGNGTAIEFAIGIGKKTERGDVVIETLHGNMYQRAGKNMPEAQTVRFEAD